MVEKENFGKKRKKGKKEKREKKEKFEKNGGMKEKTRFVFQY